MELADYQKYKNLFKDIFPENYMPKLSFETHDRGTLLLKQDEPAKLVYFLCEGRLRVFRETDYGEENRIVWIYPGDSVGELESIAGLETSSYSSEVFEDDTKVIKIKREDFIDFMKNDHEFCFYLAQLLAKKLYLTSREFSASYIYDYDIVIQRFIVDYVSQKIKDTSNVVLLHTRADIAQICGVSERTVNRAVKKLKDKKFVSIVKGKVCVDYSQYKRLMEELVKGGKDKEFE